MPKPGDQIVTLLRSFISKGEYGLAEVPALIKAVIDDGIWRERTVEQTGEIVRFERFVDFVTTAPLEGLGADIDTIKRLCRDDAAALDALDRAVQNRPGRPSETFDNVQGSAEAPTGNRADQAIRKLRKDRPDLHERVLAGEVSPHAAMVEAGFRRRSLTVPVEAEAAARVIRRHFPADELDRLVELLEAD